MKRTLDFDTLTLAEGGHNEDEWAYCVMEAVAYVAGEPWSDHPQCASPVVGAFCRAWNDVPGEDGAIIRERLKSYIPRLVGSRSTDAQERRRSLLVLDWIIRTWLPTWLRLRAELATYADELAALAPLTEDGTDYAAIGVRVRAVRAAVRAAAWAAAWDAAKAAAWDAAKAAVRAAAWDAAWDAAKAAAGDAAWDAAGDAAWAAAGDAAWDAAGDAAWAAATQVLRPTVEQLQASAWDLLDRLIAVTA